MSEHSEDLLTAFPEGASIDNKLLYQLGEAMQRCATLRARLSVHYEGGAADKEMIKSVVQADAEFQYLTRSMLVEFNRDIDKGSMLTTALQRILFNEETLRAGKEKEARLVARGYPVKLVEFEGSGALPERKFFVLQYTESMEVNEIKVVKGQYPMLLEDDDVYAACGWFNYNETKQ